MQDPFNLYQSDEYAAIHKGDTIPFPKLLIMQASSYCNFECRQCPRVVKVPRRKATGLEEGFMGLDLVKKAAEEFQSRDGFLGVLFALYGEPLMNPRIADMVRIVKSAGKKVQVTTNALLLTTDMVRRLIDSGIDKIKISFQGTTKEEYAFWRNTPHYDRIVRHIDQLLELRTKLGAPLFVQIGTSVANDTDEQIDAFIEYWQDKVDHVYYDATGMLHLADQPYVKGKEFRHQAVRRTAPCFDIFTRMSVLHNGRVPLCVDDEEHDQGNLYDQTIEAIWKSRNFEANRQTILTRGNVLPPCRYCYTSPRPRKTGSGKETA